MELAVGIVTALVVLVLAIAYPRARSMERRAAA